MTASLRSLARKLSRALDSSPRLKGLARDLFLALPASLRGPQMIHDHLTALHRRHGPRSFLLIGANDGVTDDHLAPFIRKHGWRGVAVEPVPQYFKQYCANYHGYPVRCLNVAIHETADSLDFNYLEDLPDQPLPAYAKGVGSFNRSQVEWMATEVPNGGDHIRTMDVACLSLDKLMKETGMAGADVIIIDTEGYDAQVVAQIDLKAWNPQVVVFEHKLLSPEALQSALELLEKAGFQHRQDAADVLAWR